MRVKLEVAWVLIFLLCGLLCGPLTSFIWLVSFYTHSHPFFPTISTMSSKLFFFLDFVFFFLFKSSHLASFSELHTLHTVHLTMRTHRVSVPQIRQTGRLKRKKIHFFVSSFVNNIVRCYCCCCSCSLCTFFHKRLPFCLSVCSLCAATCSFMF